MTDQSQAGTPAVPSQTARMANTRVRRREKRTGPPQLQFVTATDLSQFRDEDAKRSVRSQAMIQYRYKSSTKKKKSQASSVPTPADNALVVENNTGPAGEKIVSLSFHNVSFTEVPDRFPELQPIYDSTLTAWHATNMVETGPEQWWWPVEDSSLDMWDPYSRQVRVMSQIPYNAPVERVIDYDYSEDILEMHMRILVGRLARTSLVDDGVDPFNVIPKFSDPRLNAITMVRHCELFCIGITRYFIT